MVAIKASMMNNMNSEGGRDGFKEEELEDYLVKITETDPDFTGVTPNVMSPDKMWSEGSGKVGSLAGTPTDFR